MEYVQMTLDDWLGIKEQLKEDLIGVQRSFVRIGYRLRQIEEQKLYQMDGYKSIAEFAKQEYGLSAPSVSRFISINKKYSVGGNSERLRPEFAQMGQSKLTEMLQLPDSDMEMIKPEAYRDGIRELNRFNKQEPVKGEADEVHELVQKFVESNAEDIKILRESEAYQTDNIKAMAEIICPSGSRTYKKGLYFLMMYKDSLKIKKFGGKPEDMTWEKFFSVVREVLNESQEERDSNVQNEVVEVTKTPEESSIIVPLQFEKQSVLEIENEEENNETEVVEAEIVDEVEEQAPILLKTEEKVHQNVDKADKKEEKREKSIRNIPVKKENTKVTKMPEESSIIVPAQFKKQPVSEPKKDAKKYQIRKEYLANLKCNEMAEYMAKAMKENVGPKDVTKVAEWEKWLNQKVDENGEEKRDE